MGSASTIPNRIRISKALIKCCFLSWSMNSPKVQGTTLCSLNKEIQLSPKRTKTANNRWIESGLGSWLLGRATLLGTQRLRLMTKSLVNLEREELLWTLKLTWTRSIRNPFSNTLSSYWTSKTLQPSSKRKSKHSSKWLVTSTNVEGHFKVSKKSWFRRRKRSLS